MEILQFYIRDCFAVMFCSAVMFCFLFGRGNYDTRIRRYFTVLASISLAASLCDAFDNYLGTFDHYIYARCITTGMNFLLTSAAALCVILIMKRDAVRRVRYIMGIPQAISTIVVILALFTKIAFYYDANNTYHIGPLGLIPQIVLALYLLMIVVLGICVARRRPYECAMLLVCLIFLGIVFMNDILHFWEINLRGTAVGIAVLAYFMYFTSQNHDSEVQVMDQTHKEAEEELTRNVVDQAIETLAYTIEAKDIYTRGHSVRVAKYARRIAQWSGKSETECRNIYLAGLLHDIGKISISGKIINKSGRLTDEEYEKIKGHPAKGAAILEKMTSIPFLQDGAKYHHERYDGKGYPCGLKGKEIPEMARIIAVADAYDAMTSVRSYREMMSQADAKQEIWKGAWTQFDPYYAKVMMGLIDADICYEMREKREEKDEVVLNSGTVHTEEAKQVFFVNTVMGSDDWLEPLEPVKMQEHPSEIIFVARMREAANRIWNAPVFILYSSDDGRVCGENYQELSVYRSDAYCWRFRPVLVDTAYPTRKEAFGSWNNWMEQNKAGLEYRIIGQRKKNEITFTIDNDLLQVEAFVQVPEDYDREIYMTVSAELCDITDYRIK